MTFLLSLMAIMAFASGHMQRLQKVWTDQGVAWLMITSSAEGAHSHLMPDQSRAYLADEKVSATAHLLDATGPYGCSVHYAAERAR